VSDAAPLYLDTAEAVDRFLADIGQPGAIALDTEGASFHRFVDRIYLLQLSTERHHAVIDPLPIGTPERLGRLLQDRGVEVVLHDADYDLRLLRQDYGWQVNTLFDTRVASQLLGLRSFGLAALLEQFFGIKLDKKHQRADWSMRPLSADMLEYAALDTRWLLDLRAQLRRRLEQAGRWHWAQEEFARAEGTQWAPEEATQAFMKLKGARDLSRRELARLRELVAWRDEIAREIDRATFRVIGNETLFELAKLAPQTPGELVKVKGFPRSMSESRMTALLAALRRGDAVPEAELPRFPKAPRWDRDPDFDDRVGRLKAVRDTAATRLDLDPGVLCSRERLETVARRQPRALEEFEAIPDMRRWQAEVLGEGFLRALHPKGVPASVRVTVPDAVPASGASSAAAPGSAGSGRTASGTAAASATEADESPYRSDD
jgi:ribonuclease D